MTHIGSGRFWDITVPGPAHYLAEGLWHHNSGKTHAITSYLVNAVRQEPELRSRIIAPTLDDAINSDVYGPAGILAKDDQVRFIPSAPGGASLKWPSGAECRLIGTPTPRDVDRLRATGNRTCDIWEEAAANPQLASAWVQAELGRRLGNPRWVAATTPRPLPLLRKLRDDDRVVVTTATLHDNPFNPEEWVTSIDATYAGTRLYRQEVLGEIIDEVEGALWKPEWIDRSRVVDYPGLLKTAVGIDPAVGGGTTGIIVVGRGVDGHLYVLEDCSQTGVSAEKWASVATAAAARWNAVLVAENDQGGDMVRAVLKAADSDAVVKPARARGRGSKKARAEPVALHWEKEPPDAHMVGSLPRLEDEMTTWDPEDGDSPDRVDGCTWAITWLEEGASWSEVSMHRPAAGRAPAGAARRPAGFRVRRT